MSEVGAICTLTVGIGIAGSVLFGDFWKWNWLSFRHSKSASWQDGDEEQDEDGEEPEGILLILFTSRHVLK